MAKRRVIFWLAGALITVAALAALVPSSPLYVIKLLYPKGEYDGKPASYWIGRLSDPDNVARFYAIRALGAIGPDAGDGVPALAKVMLEDNDQVLRSEAAKALAAMDPASAAAVPQLAQALDDKYYFVRMNAGLALFRLRTAARPAIPALIKAIKDDSNQTNLKTFLITVQEQAVLALGRASAGTTEGVPTLTELLASDKPESLRRSAAQALGEVGPEARSAVPKLRELSGHPNDYIRQTVERALEKIGADRPEKKDQAGAAAPLNN
jgi:HEAT repeat protein